MSVVTADGMSRFGPWTSQLRSH